MMTIEVRNDPRIGAASLLAMAAALQCPEPRPMGNHRYCKGPIRDAHPAKKKSRKAAAKARRRNRR